MLLTHRLVAWVVAAAEQGYVGLVRRDRKAADAAAARSSASRAEVVEPPTSASLLIALQQAAGNQAATALVQRQHQTIAGVPPGLSQAWGPRVTQAQTLPMSQRGTGGAMERMYAALLAELFGARVNVVHGQSGRRPGVVNFDPGMSPDRAGEGGLSVPLPTTRAGPIPEPTLTLGPQALASPTPLHALMTRTHEAQHVMQAERAIGQLQRWRRARTRQPFLTWLRRRVSPLNYEITSRLTSGPDPHDPLLETDAHLKAFRAGFTAAPVAVADEAFSELDHAARLWYWTGNALREPLIAPLRATYRTMDAEHRAALDAYARRRLAAWRAVPDFEGQSAVHFYEELSRWSGER